MTRTKSGTIAALLLAVGAAIAHFAAPGRASAAEAGHHSQAEQYDRLVEEKLKHTYPATAARMLAECGGIREGICLDLGCGGGQLDVELAKQSRLKIIGLDIDPNMKSLFEKRIRAAGLEKRVSFVVGDAQKLPFPDHYADIVVSRGMLNFVPDIKACLREVNRVLKPTGVAFLGGRYLYAGPESKITTEALRKLVAESGVAGAEVVDSRGQWVKILRPQTPSQARQFQHGPQMLAYRLVADYGITKGDCLLICRGDGAAEQALQQGLVDSTELRIIALYPSEKAAKDAEARIRRAGLDKRIQCKTGDVDPLRFAEPSFDLVVALGGVPFWKDREKAFREIHRVLRPGGAALAGGFYRFMPESRRVSSESLRETAARTGIPSIRILDDMGQWVEIRKAAKQARPVH
jgi:ubiquinone/menaquinone biosynthesis C-methylase UbiE